MNSPMSDFEEYSQNLGPPVLPEQQMMECLAPDQIPPGFFVGAESAGERSEPSLVKGTKSPTLPKTPSGTAGAYTVIQYREWADEYRIRTRVDTVSGAKPPENSGERITKSLTYRAARKIMESCQYVGECQGGYRTFMTLTFDTEHRARITAGDTTIQREVTRFTDALQKWQLR